jgi:osmotically-inducible protein OsmY
MFKKRRVLTLVFTGAMTYFLDPESGARRRADVAQRLGSLVRGGRDKAQSRAQSATSQVKGLAQRATHPQSAQAPVEDDVTLARKVETEIFREADVPKGQINVSAERGRVVLRGEVPSDDMRSRLESEARKVPGVSDVENLLHTPGQPAPASTPRDPEEVKAELREPTPSTGYGQSASSAGTGREPGRGDGSGD